MTEFPMLSLPIPNDWERKGLPGWCYHSPALFDLERRNLFLTHWQVVGHENDVPAPGDWMSFDLLGERAVIMRGQDGVVRAFHNLCRHRGARVVDGEAGHCKGAIVCPFHGWVYNLDGTLRGAAQPSSFGSMDRTKFGLKPIELQEFHGFLFIRFADGPQPDIKDLLAPYEADFAACLDTAGIPDPDLVIRTSGETRTSNFLPWQSAYAEYDFTPTLWPDFSPEHLAEILDRFGLRDRRFGGA